MKNITKKLSLLLAVTTLFTSITKPNKTTRAIQALIRKAASTINPKDPQQVKGLLYQITQQNVQKAGEAVAVAYTPRNNGKFVAAQDLQGKIWYCLIVEESQNALPTSAEDRKKFDTYFASALRSVTKQV